MDEILSLYPARYQPRSPLESLEGGGGLSGARLWRFQSDLGRLLLRAWPPDGRGRDHIEQIHRWLFAAADLDFLPVPLRDLAGRSLHAWRGTLWELTPWLSGEPDLSFPPLAEHLSAAFTGLARFHERLTFEQVAGVSAGLQQRHDEILRLVERGFDALETAVCQQGDLDPSCRQAATNWLTLARNVAPSLLEPLMRAASRVVRIQPIVRDARPEHFLFSGSRLSAMVDFGAMGVDCVAADLARLIGAWLEGDSSLRREALAAYERVRPLDRVESELIAVFEAGTALLIGERWVRWHYLERRSFDDPDAVSVGLARGLKQLQRLGQTLRSS
jgi:homoserine kinase type II